MNFDIILLIHRITLLESTVSFALLDISVHQAFPKTTRARADLVSAIKLDLPAVVALLWPRMAKSRQRYSNYSCVLLPLAYFFMLCN